MPAQYTADDHVEFTPEFIVHDGFVHTRAQQTSFGAETIRTNEYLFETREVQKTSYLVSNHRKAENFQVYLGTRDGEKLGRKSEPVLVARN